VGGLLRKLTCISQQNDEAQVIEKMVGAPRAVLAVGFTADQVPGNVTCTEAQVKAAAAEDASASPAAIGTVDMWGAAHGTTDYRVATPLIYAESNYPGWRVEVDGRPKTLLRIDHALLGVVVPAGHHTVTFSYSPDLLGVGSAATAGGMAFLCTIIAGRFRNRIRRAAGLTST
jgi:hypothetical protein